MYYVFWDEQAEFTKEQFDYVSKKVKRSIPLVTLTDAFRRELRDVINKHNVDNMTNTPDFILVEYVCRAIEAYKTTQDNISKWFKGAR